MTDYVKLIEKDMPVICSNGTQVGTVESLDGENSIKLAPDENGKNHWIPIGWVTGVDGTVQLDRSVTHIQEEWSDSNPEEL